MRMNEDFEPTGPPASPPRSTRRRLVLAGTGVVLLLLGIGPQVLPDRSQPSSVKGTEGLSGPPPSGSSPSEYETTDDTTANGLPTGVRLAQPATAAEVDEWLARYRSTRPAQDWAEFYAPAIRLHATEPGRDFNVLWTPEELDTMVRSYGRGRITAAGERFAVPLLKTFCRGVRQDGASAVSEQIARNYVSDPGAFPFESIKTAIEFYLAASQVLCGEVSLDPTALTSATTSTLPSSSSTTTTTHPRTATVPTGSFTLTQLWPTAQVPADLASERFRQASFLANQGWIDLPYTAVGVVVALDTPSGTPDLLSGEVSTVAVKVLAGTTSSHNSGGAVGEQNITVFTANGGDGGISGRPQVGDVVRWYGRSGYTYGWVIYAQPENREAVVGYLESCCQVALAAEPMGSALGRTTSALPSSVGNAVYLPTGTVPTSATTRQSGTFVSFSLPDDVFGEGAFFALIRAEWPVHGWQPTSDSATWSIQASDGRTWEAKLDLSLAAGELGISFTPVFESL